MATLYHFPNFHSLSSPKLSLSFHFLSPYSRANCRHNYHYSTIFASSVKKPLRASRKLKSDEELRDDIKDYLSSAGLPENHVPTMKELSVYGRQDLAHIVRRRGYKFIRQLLETSSTENSFESNGEATTSRDNYISTRQHTSTSSGDSDDEKVEDQADVKRLRFLLHQKEMELTQLKEQIEKEKLALSHLHSEAEEEISQADELVSEKETELHAAEEALSGLKKVEIKYAGEGETVELAGSFNGWQHKIPMEPRLSSIIFDSTESKKTRDWRAVLWLYPGVYEIKFVVDGDWRIDTEKESINRNGVPNNILRVDRSDGVDEC